MYRYKRLLIGLTGTDRDKATVQYASMVSRMARSERAYFAHVIKSLDIPEDIRREYPQLLEPVGDYVRDRMSATAAAHLSCHPEMKAIFDVLEGAPLTQMLRLTQQKEIDLVLIGKTKEHQSSGMLPEKLARKAPCSVLIVPEDSEPRIRRILVAVDFSEHSSDALEVAVAFASAGSSPEILCVHIYDNPTCYMQPAEISTGIYENLAAISQEHAQRHFRNLLDHCDWKDCLVRPLFLEAGRPWQAIADVAEKECADLIVVGARGRTTAAALVLGSVTERLIGETAIPLLAVKKKGTGLRLLDVLLGT